ncbi:MAG: hypothetical protein ACI4VT_05050 [Bacilli bacterium]
MNYYNEIKNRLIDNEIYSRVKDYSKERHKVITYFEIGKLLNEAGGNYGDNIIDENLRKINQDKTIGIIICKQDNKYVIKYCSDDRIIAREYELV